MFRKSRAVSNPDLFNGIEQSLDPKRLKEFNDPDKWYNLFFKHITSLVNEEHFNVLFCQDNGRPNAPIRVLFAMMVLKEGFGWSDEQLFEQCDFNNAVRRSLGFNNMTDTKPAPATYYNFRKALWNHQRKSGQDLMADTFHSMTKAQASLFGTGGQFARMDSTLIGSNIAKTTRFQLIISVLSVFCDSIKDRPHLLEKIPAQDRQMLDSLTSRTPAQLCYRLDNEQLKSLITDVGYVLLRLTQSFAEADSDKYGLICRVLAEQYVIDSDKVTLRAGRDVAADS